MTTVRDIEPEKLSFDEIDRMIHNDSSTLEQLDLLAAYTRRLNEDKRRELDLLTDQLNRIETRLASLR